MSPAKSALLGILAGLVAYVFAANVGGVFNSGDTGATISDTIEEVVTESLAPGADKVTGGAKKSGTTLAPSGTTVAPRPSPSGTSVAPVTPRSVAAASATPTPSAAASKTPTPAPVVPHTNTPTPSPTHTPSPTVSPTPSATPVPETPTPAPEPTQTPVPTPSGTAHVVINEIAWSGTATSSADEWLELYNSGDGVRELDGWSLCGDGLKIVTFSAEYRIQPGEFFLIERTDNTTVSDIPGDYVGSFSKTLVDGGLVLTLRSGDCTNGAIIDEVGPGAWYAGTGPTRNSMERISAVQPGNESSNWATWGTIPDSEGQTISTGSDAAGNPIKGTPKYQNSVTP